jgi:hypothetical protein
MPLIELTFAHGRTREDAQRRLEAAVRQIGGQFGTLIQRTDWAPERDRVKLEGPGVWLEISVDAQNVHATGDAPFLGKLLGSPIATGLKQLLSQAFQKKLPS